MTPSGQKLLMLVDGEPAQQRLVTVLAARGGWRTIIAEDAESALATLGTRDGMMLDAVLIDQAAPGSEVGDLLAEIQARRPALPVMILTAFGSVDVAVAAMREGGALARAGVDRRRRRRGQAIGG
jgi:DNA-binding NtrC family response regulator